MSPAATERSFDCDEVERFSFAYLDGEFAAAESLQFEVHLAGCPTCAKQIQEATALRTMVRLRGRGAVRASDELRARVGLALERAETFRSRESFIALVRHAWPSVAAGLAVAAAIAFVFQEVAPGVTNGSMIDDAVTMHSRALPLEVSTADLGHLLPLFERHLDFAVRPPAFPPHRIALVGGRLSHLGARDAAYLEYGAGPGRRISLFIISDPGLEFRIAGARVRRVADREVLLTSVRGHNVALWRNQGIVYSLVSDLDNAETLALLSSAAAR